MKFIQTKPAMYCDTGPHEGMRRLTGDLYVTGPERDLLDSRKDLTIAGEGHDLPAWPQDGPATERSPDGGRDVYRKPTIYNMSSRGTIDDRGDFGVGITYDEDGTCVTYNGTISHDDMVRLLAGSGQLTRTEHPGRKPR